MDFWYAINALNIFTNYSLFNMEYNNTEDKDNKCLTLMDNEEFQYMFEIEIHKYVESLCNYTRGLFHLLMRL